MNNQFVDFRQELRDLHGEGRRLRWEEEFGTISSMELINLRGLFRGSNTRKLVYMATEKYRVTLAELLQLQNMENERHSYSQLRLSQTTDEFYTAVDEAIEQEGLTDASTVLSEELRNLYYRLRSMGYSHEEITQ